jgi:PAS domain S-box-containing protein
MTSIGLDVDAPKLAIKKLTAELEEANQTLRAIRAGEVDALIVSGPDGERVFTLQGAEQPYRALVQAINEGALTLLPDGTILYSNERFAELLKTALQHVIGSSFQSFLGSSERSKFESLLNLAMHGSSKGEFMLEQADDALLPVSLSIACWRTHDLQALCMVVSDISERKRAQDALVKANDELEIRVRQRTAELEAANRALQQEIAERERSHCLMQQANERLETVLESIPDNFFAFSKDWRYTYINTHGAEQMKRLGKDPASSIGKLLWDEFPHVPNEADYRRVMSERVQITDELYYPPLGEWVENHIFPSRDGGFVVCQRYISERKRIEDKLRRSEAYLAEGQRISHTGSWALNVSTGALFWSLEHFRICGVDPETFELTLETARQLIHPDDRLVANQILETAVRERSDFEWDLRVLRPDGTVRYVHSEAHPVFSDSGELIEYVGTILDNTERQAAETALRKAQSELAHVTRTITLGELTGSIAHEINQPLAAVVTNAHACLRWLGAEPVNPYETRAAAERIIRDANRASAIISRIRAFCTRTATLKAPLQIVDILSEVSNLVQSEMRTMGVWLRVEAAREVPLVVADRVQMQQVILNLVMNAMDAMRTVPDAWRVLVMGARRCSEDAVLVTIRDTGMGLAPTQRDRVFDAFYTTKPHGMGLGLAISRTIVDAHGGRLWAEANVDRGETFQFTVPIAATAVS